MNILLWQDYERAKKSIHIPFITEVANRLSEDYLEKAFELQYRALILILNESGDITPVQKFQLLQNRVQFIKENDINE